MAPAGDAGPSDAAGDAPVPLTLDIAVTGCASLDVAAVVCQGAAPLTLAFSPVGSPALTSFLWTFGDSSAPSSQPAPTHTYALPGTYDVSVTGGGSIGMVSQVRRGLVVVQAIPAGGACDVDAQCANGLTCYCSAGRGCGPAFARGICSTPCPTGFCGDAVCAATALPTSAPDGAAGVATPICLADCAHAACGPGLVCQSFHGAGAGATGWVRGCLPIGAAADLGSSCRTAAGTLDDSRCTTGFCAGIAANGLCAAHCEAPLTCPPGSACARLPGGQLCLAACSPAQPCDTDPTAACQTPTAADAGVDGGLPTVSGDFSQTYCAPR